MRDGGIKIRGIGDAEKSMQIQVRLHSLSCNRQLEERAKKSVKAKYKNEVIAHRGSLLDLEGLKEQLSKQQV